MSMNINGFGAGSNYSYKNTDTKSKQYKAAAKDHLAALMEEESMMTPEQKILRIDSRRLKLRLRSK